jgi:hypothetical protein
MSIHVPIDEPAILSNGEHVEKRVKEEADVSVFNDE